MPEEENSKTLSELKASKETRPNTLCMDPTLCKDLGLLAFILEEEGATEDIHGTIGTI